MPGKSSKTVKILMRSGLVEVPAQFVGTFWAVSRDMPGRYAATHIPTGRAFAIGYETIKLAKTVAARLDVLLPFTTEAEMDAPQRELRAELRALWPLSTIKVYGSDYKATSSLYPGVGN